MPRRKLEVTLEPSFGRELEQLEGYFRQWSVQTEAEMFQAMKQIGQRHKAEAVKRVPVDTGTLKQSILTRTDIRTGTIVTKTGTNVEYGKFVEFGTRYIAKGNVQALGTDPLISDSEAIKVWPAKNKDRIGRHEAATAAVKEFNKRLAGGVGEQMPWLRPAWVAIRGWAKRKLTKAFRSPRQ